MAEIVQSIRVLWPRSVIVHGKARHSESQGGIERLNRTVQEKLGSWMVDNNSTSWATGCRFVRWQVNTTVTMALNASPYFLLTGQAPTCGLSSLPLEPHVLENLRTEVLFPSCLVRSNVFLTSS